MKKEDSRKTIPKIDEDVMMNLMVDGINKDGLKNRAADEENPEFPSDIEKPKKTNRLRTSSKDQDYETLFFKRSETNARDGRTVYIRPDFHEKITRIVQVIGQDKISMYTYLDNLLQHHFDEFGEQIIKSFNDKYKPIF